MSFPKTKKTRYLFLTVLLVFIAVIFGLFFPESPALAQTAGNSVANFFANQISKLLYEVVSLLGRLLVEVIQILVAIAQYNDFIKATAVVKGWVIVRDICNMFFIAVLLVIAFGTILKWETYRYNKLLGRLILMAFLINFSKFICGFFIDIFQVLMMTFVNAFASVAAGNFVAAFGLEKMLAMRKEQGAEIEFSGVLGALILAIFLLTIAIIVIVVITIMLLLRILILWLLVVLSPLAFLLKSWPGMGERYSSQWWTSFGSNLTSGPVLAFFIWLSLTVMTNTSGGYAKNEGFDLDKFQGEQEQDAAAIQEKDFVGTTGSPLASKASAAISEISSSDQLLSFIISISLLVGSLMMASRMGVMGGQIAGNAVSRIQKGLTKAATLGAAALAGGALFAGAVAGRKQLAKGARTAAGFGGALLIRKAIHEPNARLKNLRFFTPTFWQGYFRRSTRLNKQAKEETAGYGEYANEYIWKGKDAAFPWHKLAHANIVNEFAANIRKMASLGGESRQTSSVYMEKAIAGGGSMEADALRQAATLMQFQNGHHDDYHQFLLESGKMDENNFEQYGFHTWKDAQIIGGASVRVLKARSLGLDRSKYDPEEIVYNQIMDAYGKDDREGAKLLWEHYLRPEDEENTKELEARWGIDKLKTAEEQLPVFYNNAKKLAHDNAMNAGQKDQNKLDMAMMSGQLGMSNGHQEYLDSIKDIEADKSFMLPLKEAAREAAGENNKQPLRQVMQKQSIHAYWGNIFDPVTGETTALGDRSLTDIGQREYMKNTLPSYQTRDIGQVQARFAPGSVGYINFTGENQAIFGEDWEMYDGRKAFEDTDERNIKGKVTMDTTDEELAKMPELEQRYAKNLKATGGDADKAELMTTDQTYQQSVKRYKAGEVMSHSKKIFSALTNLAAIGQGTAGEAVPGDEEFDAFGRMLTDKFKENPEQMEEELKYQLERRLRLGQIDRAEKDRLYTHYHPFIVKAKESGKYGKKSSMTDISEDRQNATREKVGDMGETFWLSDEYKKNQAKYYTQEQYNYNRQGINDLQKQENVSRMTGIKTAMAKSQKGGSAALAVNFDDEMFKGMGLTGAGLNLRGEEMAEAVDRLSNKYLEQMIAENENLAEGEKMTEEQMLAKAEEFAGNLKKASSLRLVNKNRKGVDVRHILAHENFHDQIDRHFLPEDLDEMWQKMGKEEQEKAAGELKNMGYDTANMNSQDIMREYLAEGLANQTRYALPGGLKLSPELIKRSQDLGIKVKGPESAEESPEIKELTTDPKDLAKLARQANRRKKAREAADKLMPWRKKKQAEIAGEEEKPETPAEKVESPKDTLIKHTQKTERASAEVYKTTLAYKNASRKRKQIEAELKQVQAERDAKLKQYNQETEEYENSAKQAAQSGDQPGAQKNFDLAKHSRGKAQAQDDHLNNYRAAFGKAKAEEEMAQKEAADAINEFNKLQGEMPEKMAQRAQAEKGGQAGYDAFIKDRMRQGISQFGGSFEKYRDELERKIKEVEANLGVSMPIEAKLDLEMDKQNWQEELKRVEKQVGAKKGSVKVGVAGKPEEIPSAKISPETKTELKRHLKQPEGQKAVQEVVSSCEQVERATGKEENLTVTAILEMTKTLSDSIRDLETYFRVSTEKLGDKDGKVGKFVNENVSPMEGRLDSVRGSNLRDDQIRQEDTYILREIARNLKRLFEKGGVSNPNVSQQKVEDINE